MNVIAGVNIFNNNEQMQTFLVATICLRALAAIPSKAVKLVTFIPSLLFIIWKKLAANKQTHITSP